MIKDFYIDDSGNTGDLISTGNNFDFGGQPVFALAAVGIPDKKLITDFFRDLKRKYNIQSGELKAAKIYKKKPKLLVELISYLVNEKLPIFIELVDKKYFIATNLVNYHVMPPYFFPPEDQKTLFLRKTFADFIYENAPDSVFQKFIQACQEPSESALKDSFSEIRKFPQGIESDLAEYFERSVVESLDDFEKMKKQEGREAYKRFLPLPDDNKHLKLVWMLPNLSSFTNLYARINKFVDCDIDSVNLFHDEQLQFDEILAKNKEIAENLDVIVPIASANFQFTGKASLSFLNSEDDVCIQVADLLAGTAMRVLTEKLTGNYTSAKAAEAYELILKGSNHIKGQGVNLVTSTKIHHELHF